MKEFKITDTEVIDNTVADHDGNIQPSEISILVEIEINGKPFCLDFQTTNTMDYGAYSSDLWPYDGTDDYSDLEDLFDDDNEFADFIENVKTKSNAQAQWHEYVSENFNVRDEHFSGMDANSETNKAIKK